MEISTPLGARLVIAEYGTPPGRVAIGVFDANVLGEVVPPEVMVPGTEPAGDPAEGVTTVTEVPKDPTKVYV